MGLFLHIADLLWTALKSTARTLLDSVPPYRTIEGRLEQKEERSEGEYYILVASEILQVDGITYKTLMVGEALRVRSTRSNKAISIDRLSP